MNRRAACGIPAACLLFTGCVPWTVRPIQESQDGPFDARRYVDSIWSARVLPAVSAGAVDLAGVLAVHLADPGRRSTKPVLVRGEGKVIHAGDASRSGLLLLDLPPYDGRADAALQIGPVVRGTALRDALPFIQFSQFVNQLDFARAGSALNERAVKGALAGISVAGLAGAELRFAGAAEFPPADLPRIVPVTLSVQRGGV